MQRKEGKFVSMPKMLLTGMTCEKRRNLWGNQMDTYAKNQRKSKEKSSGWKMEMQNEQSTELKTWENPAKTIPVPSADARCKANWMI